MRTFINSTSLSSFIVRSPETGNGSEAPSAPVADAKQPVPTAATIATITEAETAARKAKAAVLKAKRDANAATKPAAKPIAGKPSKPGKAASAAKPVKQASAKPDPRVEKAARVSADRNAVNALYSQFETNRVSIPIKALSAFKPMPAHPHNVARNPSIRQAAAIALAFAANGKKLTGGGTVNRVFELRGVRSCVENGVLADALSSGLCTVSGDTPETERLTVSAKQATAIVGLIGTKAASVGKLA